jgi:hypothetical protein
VHNAWPILRLAWSAAVVVYLVLCAVQARRLRGWERKFDNGLLAVVVLSVAIRVFARYGFRGGLVSQFALVLAGVAAAIGILVHIKAMITQEASEKLRSGSACRGLPKADG